MADLLLVSNIPFGASEARRAAIETQARNSGQIATISSWYVSTGVGVLSPDETMEFGTTFVAEPGVATGAVILSGDVEGVSAGVRSWVRDDTGYYTGAKVWINVLAGSNTSQVRHTFSFTGVAIKVPGPTLTSMSGAIPGKISKIGP